jgi:hypothetical protein
MTERRNALVLMFCEENQALPEQRTYICFGAARGGTSAIAGSMQRIGLWMGDALTNNYEDPDFVGRPIAHMMRALELRNQTKPVWGWKCPDAVYYLDALLPQVRNPHLVLVCRDIAATMKGHMRWHNRSDIKALHEIMIQHQRNLLLAQRWSLPTALVSYEKAITYPRVFAHNLAAFIGTKISTETADDIAEFTQPGKYK